MGGKTGRTIEAYEKDQRALELRKEGHTYESISEQLWYSTPSASYKAVMRRLRDMDRPAHGPIPHQVLPPDLGVQSFRAGLGRLLEIQQRVWWTSLWTTANQVPLREEDRFPTLSPIP